MQLRHRIAALVSATTLGLFVGATATPAQAAEVNDLNIKHSSLSDRSTLGVCRDWSGTPEDPGCANSSPTAQLPRGNTTGGLLGWKDADGFWLNAGYNATVSGCAYLPKRVSATGWHKLYGCNGGTRTVDLWRE